MYAEKNSSFPPPSQQISVRYAKYVESVQSDGAKIDIMRWYGVQ